MNKTRGEQLRLRFEVSRWGEDAVSSKLQDRSSASVFSLDRFRQERHRSTDEVERTLLERALKSVRLFK